MRIYHLLLFIPLCFSVGAVEKEYVIDFSESFSMEAFADAGVSLETPSSIAEDPNRRNLPKDARYIFKLPSSNTFVFEARMGDVTYAHNDRNHAGRLVLYGNGADYYLRAEEAYTVLKQFHEVFEIPSAKLDTWFEPVKNEQLASSFYQATTQKNYPRITIEVANSFLEEAPVFLNLFISFDQKSFNRLGISEETNKTRNLTFDVPEIVDLVSSQTASAEIPATPPVPEVEEIVQEVTQPELTKKEPVEVAPVEVDEKNPGQSSQWWLWLIGLLVVVGGLVVVVRRKS